MDFVARAGTLLDRAHRIAGFLLIICVVLTMIIFFVMQENAKLRQHIWRIQTQMPVYVVPGSKAKIYSPTEDDLLVNAFVDLVTQSLNTFTYETLGEQYNEVKKFFSAEMLAFSKDYYAQLIQEVQQIKRSALFVPDRRSMRVETVNKNGVSFRNVVLRGSLQQIVAGSLVETIPLEVSLVLRETAIGPTNPFGFLLTTMKTRELGGR